MDEEKKKCSKWHEKGHKGMFCCFYLLTFIGAAIYYIQEADAFWIGVLGFLKAIVWPVFMMYEVLTRLGM